MARIFVLLRSLGLGMFLVFAVSACGQAQGTSAPESLAAGQTDASAGQWSAAPTANDVFAEVGRRVPAFGGMFVDEDRDTLYVYLVPGELGDAADAARAIAEVFGPGRPPAHRLEALEGQYTFLQLKSWLDRVTPRVLGIAGVVSTYIDDGKNRLVVGVETMAMASPVEAELTALAIPREAVNIQLDSPSVFPENLPEQPVAQATLAPEEPTATLRDRFRPLVGGLQATTARTGINRVSVCTLGFIALQDKGDKPFGFVYNSHCLKDITQITSNMVYQPTEADANLVGKVTDDPPVFKHADNAECPEDKMCRWADSAFVTLNKKEDGMQGAIAKPALNSDVWDGKSLFSIVGVAVPVKGLKVERVSSQTGRREGEIDIPCSNRAGEINLYLLCQTVIKSSSNVVSGDSGSPVYAIKDGDNVNLLGILWGNPRGSPSTWVVSPMRPQSTDGKVQPVNDLELGPLKVCTAGAGC